LQHLVDCSVKEHDALEDITYPVITEFLLVHKDLPHQFTFYSEMMLRWNPDLVHNDRSEIPDVGLVNFRCNRPFIFQLGVKSKRITSIMAQLPPNNIVENDDEVRFTFHTAYYQAEDQVKAAVHGDCAPCQWPMDYFLFVGPYWTHVIVGPFSEAQLMVRTHKPSGSVDFQEVVLAKKWLAAVLSWRKLFLLSTADSALKMESVIASTDSYSAAAMQEAVTYPAWAAQQ
jgi:hypothetical protein